MFPTHCHDFLWLCACPPFPGLLLAPSDLSDWHDLCHIWYLLKKVKFILSIFIQMFSRSHLNSTNIKIQEHCCIFLPHLLSRVKMKSGLWDNWQRTGTVTCCEWSWWIIHCAPDTLPQQTQKHCKSERKKTTIGAPLSGSFVFCGDSFIGLREHGHCCFFAIMIMWLSRRPVEFLFYVSQILKKWGELQASLGEVARHDIDRWPFQNFTQFPVLELYQTFSFHFFQQNSCRLTRHPFLYASCLS